jgi:hypothetical protein
MKINKPVLEANLNTIGFLVRDRDGDWKEDATHENGNYFCYCQYCKKEFIGHKRRVRCKLCSNGK